MSGPVTALEVVKQLKEGQLAIYTREYRANNGVIEFDIRAVNQYEMTQIVERLRSILNN